MLLPMKFQQTPHKVRLIRKGVIQMTDRRVTLKPPTHTRTHTLYYATYTRNHQSARWNMCKSMM